MIKIADVLALAEITELPSPDGKGEVLIKCLSPDHADKHPSLSVNLRTDVFKCHSASCGISGGAKDMAELLGVDWRRAAVKQEGSKGGAATKTRGANHSSATTTTPVAESAATFSAIDSSRVEGRSFGKLGKPSLISYYRTWDGYCYQATLRFDTPDGKVVYPLVNHKERGYSFGKHPKQHPYRIEVVFAGGANARKPLWFCEGEPSVHACQKIIGDAGIAVGWQGGSNAVGSVKHFEEMAHGCDCVLWADNDAGGEKAMVEIHRRIAKSAKSVKYVVHPLPAVEKSDAVDALAAGITADKIVTETRELPPVEKKKRAKAEATIALSHEELDALAPVALGYDENFYYVWSPQEKLVRDLRKSSGSVRDALSAMAPLRYYKFVYGTTTSGKLRYEDAVSDIMEKCRVKWFDTDNVRGRGVAAEGDRVVANLGDRLLVVRRVGGSLKWEEQSMHDQSELRYIYKRGKPLKFTRGRLLGGDEVEAFARSLDLINWKNRDAPRYLVGWMAAALVGGALRWRPQCWISGATSSGKTYIMKEVIRKMFGNFCVMVAANSTEPGLRARLKNESIPVVFDEAEGGNESGGEPTIQPVITMARVSSSAEDDMEVVKGRSGGDGVNTYNIRSCFCFASIKTGLIQSADRNRFVQLVIGEKNKSESQFKAMEKVLRTMTLDGDWVNGFQATCVAAAQRIHDKEEVFVRLVADRTDRRTGDKIGAVLAAYFVLTRQPDGTEADFLSTFDFGDDDIYGRVDTDDDEILRRLFQFLLPFPHGKQGSIYQMLDATDEDAKVLEAYGIQVTQRGKVVINGNNTNIEGKIFHNTQWRGSWFSTMRHNPAVTIGDYSRKVAGKSTRKWASIDRDYLDDMLGSVPLADANDGGLYNTQTGEKTTPCAPARAREPGDDDEGMPF